MSKVMSDINVTGIEQFDAEQLARDLMRHICLEMSPSQEARQVEVTRLVNELSGVGWPTLRNAAGLVLGWNWNQEKMIWSQEVEQVRRESDEGWWYEEEEIIRVEGGPLYLSAPLQSALERACSDVEGVGPIVHQHLDDSEEKHLLDQLKTLLSDLELHVNILKLNEVFYLRAICWIKATQWLLDTYHFDRSLLQDPRVHQRIKQLLINVSDKLGIILETTPDTFVTEGIDLLVTELRTSHLSGGVLKIILPGYHDHGGQNELKDSALLTDLRGVEHLVIEGYDSLGWLGFNIPRSTSWHEEWGEREIAPNVPLGLTSVISIDLRNLRIDEVLSLGQCGLLTQVYLGTTKRPERGQPTEALSNLIEVANIQEHTGYLKEILKRSADELSVEIQGALFTMKVIPPGRFWMGDHEYEHKHRVRIRHPLLVGETLVTQAQWDRIQGVTSEDQTSAQCPVGGKTWAEAIAFCNKLSEGVGLQQVYDLKVEDQSQLSTLLMSETVVDLDIKANGYRLPSEAECEYTAKAGMHLSYAGSNQMGPVGWYGEIFDQSPEYDVKLKRANGWGLYDMSGQLSEWCNDVFDRRAYLGRSHGVDDPLVFQTQCIFRVHRGGDKETDAEGCQIGIRDCNGGDEFLEDLIGLRIYRTLIE